MLVFPKTKMEFVDLSLPSGVKWASCNIGASSPEDCGLSVSHLECDNFCMNLEVPCRVPSQKEWVELMRGCVWRFTMQNGVKGNLIVGSNGSSIFLPASFDDGKRGKYWSSTLDENDAIYRACYMDFDFIGGRMNGECRVNKMCLRSVMSADNSL